MQAEINGANMGNLLLGPLFCKIPSPKNVETLYLEFGNQCSLSYLGVVSYANMVVPSQFSSASEVLTYNAYLCVRAHVYI